MTNMVTERKRQELASRLVEREIYCCVSSLMSGIAEVMHDINYKAFNSAFGSDQDELQELFSPPDYEEGARQFIMDDADLDQLEEIADEYGCWEDVLKAIVPDPFETEPDEDGETMWDFVGSSHGAIYSDEDEAREDAIEAHLSEIRQAVWELVNESAGAYQWVCNEYDLEPDYLEVYEHWVVSDWLARKLSERGYITGEFAGLTIWGRCCTGQSISLDTVIQDIACELWSSELEEVAA